jgi:hypothetical protein
MRFKKSIDLDLEIDVSLEEASLIVFHKMEHESSGAFDLLVDKIIFHWENKITVPLVDVMKQEVLDKIKEEISLEKIEEFYESNRR